MKRDPNFIAALEKSAKEKYGDQVIINPKSGWDTVKEKQYLEDVKSAYKKESGNEASQEKIDLGGVLIAKKLINNSSNRQCCNCKKYSFNRDDDVYLTKYQVCTICYIAKYEGKKLNVSNNKNS
jgi:hypothetical protein